MFELGTKVIHIPSNKECLVVYLNGKEPKYRVRFPDMYAKDVYEVELEEIKEEPLLASEPALEEVVIGDESMQIKSFTKVKENMKGNDMVNIEKSENSSN